MANKLIINEDSGFVKMPEFIWSIGTDLTQEVEETMATVKASRSTLPKFVQLRTGDGTREFEQSGYYVHVMIDADAFPTNARVIRVTDGVWCYANTPSELFPVERPPSEGLLLFIY